jgi:hypothetical protein
MAVPYKLNYFEIESGLGTTSTFLHKGDLTANRIIKIGGTSNDILLGDGSTVSLSGILGNYVPYTGANANVDLGTNELSGKYLIANGAAGLGGVLSIKQDAAYLPKGNGYSSIASSFTDFDFFAYTGASTYKNFTLKFNGLTDNTRREYTLPNANGTLALTSDIPSLTGYVPYTGATGPVNLGAYDLTVNGVTVGKGPGGLSSTNTVVGNSALQNNTNGGANSAFGASALFSNTLNGNSNTAIGYFSLYSNTIGSLNTAVGNGSMQFNITGEKNVAVGSASLQNNTSGYENTALGQGAGANIIGGFANTSPIKGVYIGNLSTASAANNTNEIVIGANAIGLGSNTTVLGNTSTVFGRWFGNLLIGNSVNSGEQLQVTGTAKVTGMLKLASSLSDTELSSTINGFELNVNGSSGLNRNILFKNSGTTYLAIDNNNNVSIGYPLGSGLYKLDVAGTSRITGQLTLGSTITNGIHTYTLPSNTGTLALTSDIPSPTGYVPYTGATTDLDLGVHSLLAESITLDPTPATIPTAQGSMYFDEDEQTVAAVLNGSIMKIGEDSFFQIKNQSGSTIPKGTAVRFNGVVGTSGRVLAVPFLANGTYPSLYFLGVTYESIPDGGDGKALILGKIRGINTNAYTAGTILYASTTVAGGYQTTAPLAPNNIISVAAVVTQGTSNGTILVRPQLGSNINNDEGVKIVSPTTGDLLQLQSSGLWENKTISGAGLISGTGANGQVAFWNGTSTQTGDNGLFWDNVNKRLGIGTTSPTQPFQIETSGLYTGLFINTGNDGGFTSQNNGTLALNRTSQLRLVNGSTLFGANDRTYQLVNVGRSSTTADFYFQYWNGSTYNERFRIFSTGNLSINTATDAGFRLDVNGTARVQGVLTTTADAVVNGVSVGRGGGSITTNTRVGTNSLNVNTTGANNTAYGHDALRNNTTGSSNTANGLNALFNNTTGGSNTGAGGSALQSNTTGGSNTANGVSALQSNTTGGSNTANGREALSNNTTGGSNTANGVSAGRFIADGTTANTITNNSVFLGANSRALADNQTNQIVIGYDATGLGSNSTVIGNSSTVTAKIFGTLEDTRGTLIAGTGTSGQVAFWNGTNSQTGSNNLTYDSTNKILFLGSGAGIPQIQTDVSNNVAFSIDLDSAKTLRLGSTTRNIQVTFQSNIFRAALNIFQASNGGELARINSSGNLLLNTTTDAGFRLDVNGTARVQGALTVTGSTTASGAIARGSNFTPTLVASANNDVLVGLDINPTFNNGAFTGVGNILFRASQGANASTTIDNRGNQTWSLADGNSNYLGRIALTTPSNRPGFIFYSSLNIGRSDIRHLSGGGFVFGSISSSAQPPEQFFFHPSGNFVINQATDAGFRLDVNGTARVQGALTVTGSTTASGAIARGANFTPTLVAAANNDVLVGLDVAPTFTNGAFTGVGNIGLRVTGNASIKGSSNTGATVALTVQNSDNIIGFRVFNNGVSNAVFGLTVGTVNSIAGIYPLGTSGQESIAIRSSVFPTTTNVEDILLTNGQGEIAITSGTRTLVNITRGANPTSGTGVYNLLRIAPIINQTGGANGITRGLFIQPTLTSAADWRAIEVASGGAYINTTSVQASAILQADSTTKGFLPPRMTTTEKNAIASPAIGLMVYDTTLNKLAVYTGMVWETITSI